MDFESIISANYDSKEVGQAVTRALRLSECDFSAYVSGFAAAVGDDPNAVARWIAS